MIIFNLIGAGEGIVAAAVMMAIQKGSPLTPEYIATAAGGLTLAAADLFYRLTRDDAGLVHPIKGGHLFFIPCWLIGLVWLFTPLFRH